MLYLQGFSANKKFLSTGIRTMRCGWEQAVHNPRGCPPMSHLVRNTRENQRFPIIAPIVNHLWKAPPGAAAIGLTDATR
jgi:hypothetical protein